MQPVNVVIAAMTQHGSKGLMGAYTSDAVIIDDQAPYRWSGNDAASDWLSSLTTYGKLRYAHFTAFGDPMQVVHGPDSAYVTVLGKLRGLGARSGLQQNVLLTFTLRRVEGTWKIDSQSWTTVPPSFKWSLK
jgi:ketosteroid isomerase-like protein